MSELFVGVERIAVYPHPNADRLELAQVGLYRAVVGKGQFQDGDYAVYIPEGTILPDNLIGELGLVGKLAGPHSNRVKTVRLRGEVSQGIVCRPRALADVWSEHDWADACAERDNYAEELRITKWVPPIPPSMAGKVDAAPQLLRWIEVESLQRYPGIFTAGEEVEATEKIHGTAFVSTWLPDRRLLVSSKGIAEKFLALEDDEKNLYWRAARQYGLADALDRIATSWHATRVAIYGEVFGAGVQDLGYGADARADATLGFAAFDVRVEQAGVVRWMNRDEVRESLDITGVPAVPVLFRGPFDLDKLVALATGTETVSGTGAHLREGIVVRPVVERTSDLLGGRAIAKLVSPDYLLRSGGTEYQ